MLKVAHRHTEQCRAACSWCILPAAAIAAHREPRKVSMRRPAPLGENKEVTRVLAIDCEMVSED